jgi:hypothetical protein
MALAVSFTSFLSGQQTVSLLKNHSEEGLLPPELNAQRHRTAEIQTDLLSLAKSSTLKLDLFEDISYNVKLERLDRKHVVGDVDVYWGNSGDPAWAHLSHYNDVILTGDGASTWPTRPLASIYCAMMPMMVCGGY